MRAAVLLSLLIALAAPAAAHAAPVLALEVARPAVGYGAPHRLTGTLKDGAVPLAGQEVVLEGKRYPFDGSFRQIARTRTGPHGTFAFTPKLDRNHVLRAVAPALRLTSPRRSVYTVPSFALSFRALAPGVVRLTQAYRVPKPVKLTAKTLFYLGPGTAKRATMRISAETERTAAGRFRARVKVTLPAAWHGRFAFGTCFRTSPGSGMGKPLARCPRLHLKF